MRDFMSQGETDLSRVEREVISPLVNLCGNVGVNWREAMSGVLDGARYLRMLSDFRERNAALARGEFPELSEEEVGFYDALHW
jgi:hypothetical protein